MEIIQVSTDSLDIKWWVFFKRIQPVAIRSGWRPDYLEVRECSYSNQLNRYGVEELRCHLNGNADWVCELVQGEMWKLGDSDVGCPDIRTAFRIEKDGPSRTERRRYRIKCWRAEKLTSVFTRRDTCAAYDVKENDTVFVACDRQSIYTEICRLY